jgi:hypothetical protein
MAIVVPPGVCVLVCTHEVRALLPSRSRASTVRPVFDSTTGCLAICSQIGSALISHPDAPAKLEPLGPEFALGSDCVPQAEKTPAPASKMIAPTINDLGVAEKINKGDRISPSGSDERMELTSPQIRLQQRVESTSPPLNCAAVGEI